MSFTDDDLKRFKKWANKKSLKRPNMIRLLARLEAAEAIVQQVLDEDGQVIGEELYLTWRKAKGKEDSKVARKEYDK